jgi:hypothetical protein
MNTPAFTPEQFATRPGIAQIETELKKWLLALGVDERLEFIKRLWLVNYRFALVLLQASKLPIKETENIFRHWLREGSHNTAQELIKRLTPMLGERKFWRIASEEKISPAMREFLNYYSHGRLDAEYNK